MGTTENESGLPEREAARYVSEEATVFVIDDDPAICESVCALADSLNIRAEAFDTAEAFLTAYRSPRPGCIVADVRLIGMSGLDLQERLAREAIRLPLVLVTGYANIPLTVSAMQKGAVTLLEKPCTSRELRAAIEKALASLDPDPSAIDKTLAELSKTMQESGLSFNQAKNGWRRKAIYSPSMIMPSKSSAVTSAIFTVPTSLPFFMTEARSHSAMTSWISWSIRKIPMPSAFNCLMSSATIWVSCGPSAAVGSSIIRICASKYTARAIATDCR